MEPVTTSGALTKTLSLLKDFPLWLLIAITMSLIVFLMIPTFAQLVPPVTRTWIGFGAISFSILSTCLAWNALLLRWRSERTKRIERVNCFVLLTKIVHEKLLSWGALNWTYLDDCLNRLEQSEEAAWIDDEARGARNVFIDHARRALEVRRARNDYRNSIERSETQEYLDNSKDRLVAALLKQKLPEFFDPHKEYNPPWWQRLRKRRAPRMEVS